MLKRARLNRAAGLGVVLLAVAACAPQGGLGHVMAAPLPLNTPADPHWVYFPLISRAEAIVVSGAGDIADCSAGWPNLTADLESQIPGTVITLGDNAYDAGTPAEFNNCYQPTWGRVKDRTRPSPGNHDYVYPNGAAYYAHFGAAAGDPTKGYYSYDLGSWHLVALNSNCDAIGGCQAGSPEEKWLRADLAAHPAACTLAYWHHPRFSSGPHGSDTRFVPFWQALYDYHATLVLNGHDHDYERFAPQDPNGALDLAHGLREFVVGTGGRPASTFGPTRQPNSEASQGDVYGVLQLALTGAGYHWDFLAVPGMTYHDSGDDLCH